MELPEDVLSVVRAYSKPLFGYYKEYNHALTVLGKKKWPKLKEKLQTEPEVILPALSIYLDAFVKKQESYLLRDKFKADLQHLTETDRWNEENRIHNMNFYRKRAEEDTFWLLIRILYGDGKEYWDFVETH